MLQLQDEVLWESRTEQEQKYQLPGLGGLHPAGGGASNRVVQGNTPSVKEAANWLKHLLKHMTGLEQNNHSTHSKWPPVIYFLFSFQFALCLGWKPGHAEMSLSCLNLRPVKAGGQSRRTSSSPHCHFPQFLQLDGIKTADICLRAPGHQGGCGLIGSSKAPDGDAG